MRRKGIPLSDYPSRNYDILKEISNERLRLMGAIALAWNHLEASLDVALGASLQIPEPMWVDLTSRVNGFDGKIEIVKAAVVYISRAPELHKRAIADTLGQAALYKRYRDGVNHALILEPTEPIAPTIQRKGKTDEVLVTEAALRGLYDHLVHIVAEMDTVGWIFCDLDLSRKDRPAPEGGRQKAVKRFQESVARLHRLQKQRKSLQPLPKFPETLPTQTTSEDQPTQPD